MFIQFQHSFVSNTPEFNAKKKEEKKKNATPKSWISFTVFATTNDALVNLFCIRLHFHSHYLFNGNESNAHAMSFNSLFWTRNSILFLIVDREKLQTFFFPSFRSSYTTTSQLCAVQLLFSSHWHVFIDFVSLRRIWQMFVENPFPPIGKLSFWIWLSVSCFIHFSNDFDGNFTSCLKCVKFRFDCIQINFFNFFFQLFFSSIFP